MNNPIIPKYKSLKEIYAAADADDNISGDVEVKLLHIVEEDHHGFGNLLAEHLIGLEHCDKLTNIEYKIIGHTEKTLTLHVVGKVKLLRKVAGR